MIKKDKIHCVLLSHELMSTKIHYTSIYIFYLLFISSQFKNAKIMKIQQVHEEIHAKQFFIILLKLFSIGNSFKFKATQETRLI